ncbi:MAG: hypothetical protein IPL21_11345 [Saprospirales bacterium]|nr:hypothetical protein [Saprospirales bacterium]
MSSKALSTIDTSIQLMSLPINYHVKIYQVVAVEWLVVLDMKEHFDVSMQVGELVLFPAVRNANEDVIIAAPGTSCRHQIKDGTQKIAKHPIESFV